MGSDGQGGKREGEINGKRGEQKECERGKKEGDRVI